MADHGRVAILFGKFDGIQGFSQRADLVQLNQNRIRDTLPDPLAKEFDIGYEQIITHELDLCAKSCCQLLPARPVVFRTAVLDRDNWILGTKFLIKGDEFVCGFLRAIGFLEYIGVCFSIIEFAGGGIEREEDIFTEFVSGLVDGLPNGIESVFNTVEIWCETSLVSNRSGESACFQNALKRMKDLCTIAKSLGKAGCSFRHDHEFLKINRRIRMGATVDDVHHRNRQHFGIWSAQVTEQRKVELSGGGMRNCQ